MQNGEQQIARHYAQSGLERTILDALAASGKELDRLAPDDLAPVDEFHVGGRQATIELAAQLDVTPDMHILDVGCGIGGASRFFAQERGCRVTGIDLTEDYVRTAEALARRVGLGGRIAYRQASALALPFEPATFDGAYMIHVGMNIEDKAALFAGIRRVLRSGGFFAVYDVMRTGEGELSFPVPWAAGPQTSFLADAAAYRRTLEDAGFEILKERERRAFARAYFQQVTARLAEGGLPPLGTHLLMKGDAAQKLANTISNLERGLIAPIELIGRARAA